MQCKVDNFLCHILKHLSTTPYAKFNQNVLANFEVTGIVKNTWLADKVYNGKVHISYDKQQMALT